MYAAQNVHMQSKCSLQQNQPIVDLKICTLKRAIGAKKSHLKSDLKPTNPVIRRTYISPPLPSHHNLTKISNNKNSTATRTRFELATFATGKQRAAIAPPSLLQGPNSFITYYIHKLKFSSRLI